MKTLKECLQEQYDLGLKQQPRPTHYEYISKAVKAWLEQKRQELDPNYSAMMAGYGEDIAECAKANVLDALLEELK
jgi:hypothetical protein